MTKINIWLTLLLLLLFLFSCGSEYQQRKIRILEDRFEKADDPDEKTMLANGLQQAYSLYHVEYDDTLFLRSWGELSLQGGEFEQARKIYDDLAEVAVDDPGVFSRRALVNRKLGFLDAAARDDSIAASLHASQDESEYLSGRSDYYRMLDRQVKANDRNLAQGTDPLHSRLLRAEAFMDAGLTDAAIFDIQQVLDADSTNGYAYYLFSRVLLDRGNAQYARRVVESYRMYAVRVDSVQQFIAELESEIRRTIRLNELEQRIAGNTAGYDELIEAGAIAFQLERNPLAGSIFNRLVSTYPDSLHGYLYRGQLYIRQGKLTMAESDLKQAIRLRPDNISAHNLLGYTYLLGKQYEQVREQLAIIRSLGGQPLDILSEFDQ